MLSGILSLYLLVKFNHQLAKFNLGLLVVGLLGCGFAIYTGNIEDGRVSRQLCDPTVLKDHENFAYYLLYAFIINGFLWTFKIFILPGSYKILLAVCIFLSSIAGLSFLVYVGHKGASLVYEQAAGVDVPDKDCKDF